MTANIVLILKSVIRKRECPDEGVTPLEARPAHYSQGPLPVNHSCNGCGRGLRPLHVQDSRPAVPPPLGDSRRGPLGPALSGVLLRVSRPAPLQEPDQSSGRERRFPLVDDRKAGGSGTWHRPFRREALLAQPALALGIGRAVRRVCVPPSGRCSSSARAARTAPASRPRSISFSSKGRARSAEAEAQLKPPGPISIFPKRHQLWLRHFPGYANAQAGAALHNGRATATIPIISQLGSRRRG